jgi:hypothetical protein
MPKQIDFLFARGLSGVEGGVFGPQPLQLPVALLELPQSLARVRISVEQRELPVGRKERLMVVWSVQVDQLIPEIF